MLFGLKKKKKAPQKIFSRTFFAIDDEEEILELYQMQLQEEFQVNVNCYTSLGDAIQDLSQCKVLPELIICDISMPNQKSGLTLISELKKRDINVPVIFISGLPGGEIQDDKYTILNKPIDMKKLYREIKKKVNLSQAI